MRGLSNAVREHLLDLEKGFHKIDYKKTGMVTILEWAQVMEAGTGLHVPWLMDRSDIIDWDEMDLETNEVNYQQFLFDKGLTEKKDSKKRNVQAYVLKFSRPLYIYFDGTKTGEEAITKEEFLTACNLLAQLSQINELKEDGVADMMYNMLDGPMYHNVKQKKNLKVCLLLLKLLANGKYFMSEEEIEEEKAMDEDEPKKDNATRLPSNA